MSVIDHMSNSPPRLDSETAQQIALHVINGDVDWGMNLLAAAIYARRSTVGVKELDDFLAQVSYFTEESRAHFRDFITVTVNRPLN